ncbi:unnamed protein product [Macrosiphum euphorbiae]|uniref:PUM-HD domain-containing protein n=1 Tax=Macrosiphum euphorbiae TaxID=13131 RepID=A0AAV0WDC2_9HEMI|nr:unnamed protein product [Macrosiphum euphorbiae]
MTMKRTSSTKNSIKKKPKISSTEDSIDYTKSLTSEDAETVESGFQELDIAENPGKLKTEKKKTKAIKKTVTITDKENKSSKITVSKTDNENKTSKKTKGKSNTTNEEKPTEKPNWKEFKKEKQELRLKRKTQKCPFYEAVVKAKKLWESVRRDDCPKEKKETLLNELFKFSKSHLETMVFSHDTARIVQWMLKLGTPEIRSQVINELIKHVPKMLLSKYACLCVKNMLKQGDAEQRKIIINSLKGKIYTFTLHTNSAKIMDLIYTTYATQEQQNAMMHELYGASSILCDSPNVLSFAEVLKNSPNTKDIILAKTKDHIRKFVLKQKTSMQTTLVHNLIYEYILYTGGKNCDELFTSLKEFPIELFYTSKSGCHLAMYIIWSANSKEKKAILKQIKTTASTRDLATSEYGYLILLALFDSVDDTVLVKKTIIPEILKNIDTIATDEYGRRVILSLVAWRDSSYFHPRDIELLKKGESIKECKKDDDVRVKELLNAVSDRFLQHVQDNPNFWLSNGSIAMVLLGILKSGSGDKLKEAMTSVANYLIDPNNKVEDKDVKVPVYEHSGLHMVLRKIIGHDKILVKNNETTFSEILSSIITADTLESWIQCNRACFLLIAMIESDVQLAVENIKSSISTKMINLLKKQKFSGAKILVTKLNPEASVKN